MILNSSHILLQDIRLYGHHGVSEQERTIGAWYSITIDLGVDIGQPALIDDNLHSTVDYGTLTDVVRREFQKPAMLLETLAHRIAEALFNSSPRILTLSIRLGKLNPPVSAPTDMAAVELTFRR